MNSMGQSPGKGVYNKKDFKKDVILDQSQCSQIEFGSIGSFMNNNREVKEINIEKSNTEATKIEKDERAIYKEGNRY